MNRKTYNKIRVFATIFAFFVIAVAMGNDCFAGSKWAGNYNGCLAASGGRGGIQAVKQACEWAAGKDNPAGENGCSLWIGSVGDSVNPEIPVYGETGTIDIMFWGGCTDRTDTTSQIKVTGDGGAIVTAGKSLTRTVFPAVAGTKTQLDVATFINGATLISEDDCAKKYGRDVTVWRWHSDGASSAPQNYNIILRVVKDECGDPGDTCEEWGGITSGTSSIIVKARNTDERWHKSGSGMWSHKKEGTSPIYAIPYDIIEWRSCYYPGVQTEALKDVSHVNNQYINGTLEELSTTECVDPGPEIEYEELHNAYETTGNGEWQNLYQVGFDLGAAPFNNHDFGPGNYDLGSAAEAHDEYGVRELVAADVGRTLIQSATTGEPIYASISSETPSEDAKFECSCGLCDDVDEGEECDEDYTCACCTNTYSGEHGGAIIDATVSDGPDTDEVRVIVPYNFENSTEVTLGGKGFVYAGDTEQVVVTKVTANVGIRQNNVTNANYATIVPKSEIALFMYVSSYDQSGESSMISGSGEGCDVIENKQCVELKRNKNFGELNSDGNLGGAEKVWTAAKKSYNAFDASAGDFICVISALTPYSVTGDIDMEGGDGLWVYSVPKCKIIAKRPTFQVWGGSLYSVGSIKVDYNKKINIYNKYKSNIKDDFKKTGGKGNETNFTPWVEENLILKNGSTKTVASGAATALNSSSPAKVGVNSSFCGDQTALSFANYKTGSTSVGCFSAYINGQLESDIVGASGIENAFIGNDSKREELINYWIKGNPSGSCSNQWGGTCQKIQSASGRNIKYITGENLTISATTITKGETYLVKSDGKVTITGNIKYTDNTYNLIEQIPKVIIYAKNVDINCSVNEVDAIIITETGGTVNTCSEFSDNKNNQSDSRRSNQLKIFGMVITDNIILGRTYGSAANKDGNQKKDGIPSDGVAAEIFDFDTSILMWSEFMAGSEESDTQQIVYQQELAPRY